LPKGSTVLDFAFNISEEVGIYAITSKVNGIVKSLFAELKTGDHIEIITSPQCRPDSSWLNNVVTFKAAAYLTNYYKNKYQLNENSNIIEKPLYQKFIITFKNNSKVVNSIQKIIGIDKIVRVALANNLSNHIVSVQTNIDAKTNTNELFLKLITLKGIKNITIKQQ
jgi:(p)ppGpp synthase/HD superfamily hydrolase